MSYKLVLEDEDLIIISKAPGIEFHGESGILSLLRCDFPSLYGVHRLDRETSGLMIFSKTKVVQRTLSIMFDEKTIQKKYIAISNGKPSKKQGLVKGDLEKTRGGSYKLTRNMENPSKTRFFSFRCEETGVRGFILTPFTGKTHQLRIVMKSLGSSILGDSRYDGAESDRLYLHAYSLEFSLNGKNYSCFDYPSDGKLFVSLKDKFQENLSLAK